MRKVFLLIALVATVFASNACGKKDDSKPQEQPKENSLEQKLIGKWKMFAIGLDSQGKEVGSPIIRKCQYIEFLEHGKGQLVTYDNPNCDTFHDETNKRGNPLEWRVINKSFYLKFPNYSPKENELIISSITNNQVFFEEIAIEKGDGRFGAEVVKIRNYYERIE